VREGSRPAYRVGMRLTRLGHACLLVEVADTRILIDPGAWSPAAADQRDLSAVLVTHQHPDHLDQERLPTLLRANSDAQLLTDPDTAKILRGKGIDAEAFSGRDEVTIGAVTVSAAGRTHALIHDDIPRIANTGMRVSADGEPTLFHPGDALDAEPGQVDVLAFPLNAPWARSREMTSFLRRFNAPYAVPIHDGLLNDRGRTLYLGQAESLGGRDTQIRDLAEGESADFRT
jgi:L-ascorbate metabolism protein UlaG (beta-lactamase superfamily)